MKPTFCSLAAVAAVVTTLATPPATATRPPGAAPYRQSDEVSLDLKMSPGWLEVALIGPDDRPVAADQASGKAVLTVNGRVLGVALVPAGGNRLIGQAPYRDGDEIAADVTVTVEGRVVTARYGVR
jgi:hypothetical protein